MLSFLRRIVLLGAGLGLCGIVGFGASPSTLNPTDVLNNWLNQRVNLKQALTQCQSYVSRQLNLQFLANPNLSGEQQAQLSQSLMLQCIYGSSLVNQSLCISQPAGCTPVQLLVPTADQITQALKNPQNMAQPMVLQKKLMSDLY